MLRGLPPAGAFCIPTRWPGRRRPPWGLACARIFFWSHANFFAQISAIGRKFLRNFAPHTRLAERVFSLLKLMFGEVQMSSLADMIQAALMLRYNGRKVG